MQVNDVMIQLELHKVLKGNISNMDKEKCEELDLRASSITPISLAKNILANVLGRSSSKELLENLKGYIKQRVSQIICVDEGEVS
ncbi:hypothetical protein MTR_6g466050 [Medicago truncatula]|uniref:Uncharacterized protein n=1 Tax=Medicago truncatula TaxID=3880 RepID=A0A072UL95_MEDTR|nr:hypothetical protein MTR_6g466050 [Medicago truncatula]